MTPELESIIAETDRIIGRCGSGPEAAIPILQEMQGRWKYLPREALERVCEKTRITPAQLTGVSTFYRQFRHHGGGKHLIQVCHGTACHVAGAERVTETLLHHLKVAPGKDTSPDGAFTVERVACLGCCSLAPVMLIDELTFGRLDATKITAAVEKFLKDEAAGLHRPAAAAAQAAKKKESAAPESLPGYEIRIGLNSCCMASGSQEVRAALERVARETGARVVIKAVGCTGMCHRVPLVEVVTPSGQSTLYGDGNARSAERIVRRHVPVVGIWRKARRVIGAAVEFLAAPENGDGGKLPYSEIDPKHGAACQFLGPQARIVTANCGALDPLDVNGYMAAGGYEALRRSALERTPDQIIETARQSGLRGRGGAGFPTADKWMLTRNAPGERKFVICNGDEGDPGAFMDRMLLEAYPHRVLEGLAIAARAVGASEGYFYIRAEYRLAVQRIEKAIQQAEERGLLGERIFGSDFSLRLRVMRGAGAFVCGEETALMASIEGRRGMPRFRPPYPAEKGLWGCPTNVNNVETLCAMPWIIRNGPEAFAAIGTQGSKGTKVFALAGRVARGGLIEVPMGTTIREIVEEIGGGVRDADKGRRFKAVQIGGPSGGCVPARLSDTAIDYDALRETGAIMGSGGLVVLDDAACMVDVARFFLDFTQKESCGRCTFCRIGTKRMLEILQRLCAGQGQAKDVEELETLGHQIKRSSLCGLGKSAPNPVLTTIRFFRDEYDAHVQGRCPAGKCAALIRYMVGERCIGCTLCAQICPVNAIAPKPYKRQVVDDAICIRCGACKTVCPVEAISIQAKNP
ncbi:MAG: NAD(P)H-dependent oxidoreductase subunit E [Candidatus Sumerlaeota bacterium]|nr:NAD(P)H-dependent oxidoreductase subunit E [Candidatus Sumerlaeota bacterium]